MLLSQGKKFIILIQSVSVPLIVMRFVFVIIYVASATRISLTFTAIVFHSITGCSVSDTICLEYVIKRLYCL